MLARVLQMFTSWMEPNITDALWGRFWPLRGMKAPRTAVCENRSAGTSSDDESIIKNGVVSDRFAHQISSLYHGPPHPGSKVVRTRTRRGGGPGSGESRTHRFVFPLWLARVQNENIPSIKNHSFQSLLKAPSHWLLLSSNWPPPGSVSGSQSSRLSRRFRFIPCLHLTSCRCVEGTCCSLCDSGQEVDCFCITPLPRAAVNKPRRPLRSPTDTYIILQNPEETLILVTSAETTRVKKQETH